MNHLSIEVHPDAEWFIILMINSRIISIHLNFLKTYPAYSIIKYFIPDLTKT